MYARSVYLQVLTINVKPGWKSGTKITFQREGDQAPNKIPADIVFIIRDKPHALFKREGSDLKYTAKVSLKEVGTVSVKRCREVIHFLSSKSQPNCVIRNRPNDHLYANCRSHASFSTWQIGFHSLRNSCNRRIEPTSLTTFVPWVSIVSSPVKSEC